MRPSQHESDEGYGGLGDLIEDEYDERPTRSARRRRPKKRRNPFGPILAVIVVLALGAGIVFVVKDLFSGIGDVPDYTGTGTSAVDIRVSSGDSLSTIATTLKDKDVVKSARAFVDVAKGNAKASGIQPGLYAMKKQMKASAALDLMLAPATRMVKKVVVPEGFTTAQTLEAAAKGTGLVLAELQAAMKDTGNLGLPDWASAAVPSPSGYLEGILAPGTYEFDPATTPTEALQEMVSSFNQLTGGVDIVGGAAAVGQTPLQIVTIASMIERETSQDDERSKVARVIDNRLAQGTPLGIDATTAYGLGKKGTDLTSADLASSDPYNTRVVTGLPPTAIGAPSEASLKAALAPAAGDWIFYVLVDAEGHHFFTASAAEFEQKKAECQAKGLC